MEVLKQVLAFPLYAHGRLADLGADPGGRPERALVALFGLVLVGFAVWIYGRTRFAAPRCAAAGGVLALVGLRGCRDLARNAVARRRPALRRRWRDGFAYKPFTRGAACHAHTRTTSRSSST